MNRRAFIAALGGAAAWPVAARAQQPAMPVIGFLDAGSAAARTQQVAAFRKGLAEAGYHEGQNVALEFRWAEGEYGRFGELAADLVRRRVNVIVTPGSGTAALAAKAATSTIPIVFGSGGDPAQEGLVASLSRPGGNATGVNFFTVEVVAKRMELLRELVPTAKRIVVLVNPADPEGYQTLRDLQVAAGTFAYTLNYNECCGPPAVLQWQYANGNPISAVPEPSTWAMMLLGFAGLGFAFRKSRRKVSFA